MVDSLKECALETDASEREWAAFRIGGWLEFLKHLAPDSAKAIGASLGEVVRAAHDAIEAGMPPARVAAMVNSSKGALRQ